MIDNNAPITHVFISIIGNIRINHSANLPHMYSTTGFICKLGWWRSYAFLVNLISFMTCDYDLVPLYDKSESLGVSKFCKNRFWNIRVACITLYIAYHRYIKLFGIYGPFWHICNCQGVVITPRITKSVSHLNT